jgi:hypothetical protein
MIKKEGRLIRVQLNELQKMCEFELTNNNCLRIFEVHKIGYKENKGGRKSYDNKR